MKEAFSLLSEHRSSGIAVVDDDDVIYGNVSASDIKIIGTLPLPPHSVLSSLEFS